MGEILECLEDLDLMSRRQGSTRHTGATREIDDGCRAGTAAQRTTASDILCRRLARKDQEVEIGARSEARVLYILYDEISARARTM